MKSIIIYYSYSGNTKKVAGILAQQLKQKGEVQILELKAQDESDSFFGQCLRAFAHKKAIIDSATPDLSQYDLICFGTPVWAFGPAPAINAYLDQCAGVSGKKIILFTTYGSGAGKERCVNYMRNILSAKGAQEFRGFSVQQFQVNDPEFILSKIKEIE